MLVHLAGVDPHTRISATSCAQYCVEHKSHKRGLCVSFLGTEVVLVALYVDGAGNRDS